MEFEVVELVEVPKGVLEIFPEGPERRPGARGVCRLEWANEFFRRESMRNETAAERQKK